MFANPLESPLLAPALLTSGGLLGGSLVVMVGMDRLGRLGSFRTTLLRRWGVWLVVALIYTLAVLSGPLPAALLVGALVFQGLREYASLVALPLLYRRLLLLTGIMGVAAAATSTQLVLALPPLLLLGATLLPLLSQHVAGGTRLLALSTLGWAYLPLLLGHFLLIYRDIPGGPGILLALAMAVALSDIGAFCLGSLAGKHPLAPRLSPHKTWEGVAGNVLGAALGVLLMAFALPKGLNPLAALGLPLLVAVGSLWGDLLESLMKREFQAKDTGSWLPGFGGLLDRIDSLIVVLPISYYYLRLA